MNVIYEARTPVHFPSMNCTYPVGTRFTVNDGTVIVGGQEQPLDPRFQKILSFENVFKKLTIEEARSVVL